MYGHIGRSDTLCQTFGRGGGILGELFYLASCLSAWMVSCLPPVPSVFMTPPNLTVFLELLRDAQPSTWEGILEAAYTVLDLSEAVCDMGVFLSVCYAAIRFIQSCFQSELF